MIPRAVERIRLRLRRDRRRAGQAPGADGAEHLPGSRLGAGRRALLRLRRRRRRRAGVRRRRPRRASRPARTFKLGHHAGPGAGGASRRRPGVAVSPDGRRLLVANLQNNSVSLIDLASGDGAPSRTCALARSTRPARTARRDLPARRRLELRPPRAYVTSERDREVIALRLCRRARSRRPPHHACAVSPSLCCRRRGAGCSSAHGQYRRRRGDRHGARTALARDHPDRRAAAWRKPAWAARAPTRWPFRRTARCCWSPTAARTRSRWSLDRRLGRAAERDDDDDVRGSRRRHDPHRLVSDRGRGQRRRPRRSSWSTARASRGRTRRLPHQPRATDASQIACQAANQYVWQLEKAGFLTCRRPRAADARRASPARSRPTTTSSTRRRAEEAAHHRLPARATSIT